MKHTAKTYLLALSLATASLAAQAASPAQWQALTSQVQVKLEQAIDNATQAVAGQVVDIELDDGDGAGPRYEAQVLTPAGDSVEVWVNSANGQAAQHAQDGKGKRKDIERAQTAKISITQAVQAALAHTPGKAVKAELDSHWGQTVYKVDVLQADHTVMEVKLNAADGTIIRARLD